MMKPLATAPLEQESESSTIAFLEPDDVLRMPWHIVCRGGGGGGYMQKRLNVLRFKTWRVNILLHLFYEMWKIDNKRSSAKNAIIYH